jgi:hypothetical protein
LLPSDFLVHIKQNYVQEQTVFFVTAIY